MIETDVFSALKNHAGLSALVASRIYPIERPQDGANPAVTYFVVSNVPVNGLGGASGLGNQRFQIDCYADTYLGVKAVAAQVKAAFAAASFRSLLIADRDLSDLYEGLTKEFRVSMDFSVWSQ